MSGVPLSVLLAVSLTETGHGDGDSVRPWPWTVAIEGERQWFDTRDQALAFAEARHGQGIENFELGCFQIDWSEHHENFVSIDQMLDPLANAIYAAGFLNTLHQEGQGWSEAADAFHPRPPDIADQSRAMFEAHRATAVTSGVDEGRFSGPFALTGTLLAPDGSNADQMPRSNTYPLLQTTGGTSRLGSLVLLGDG